MLLRIAAAALIIGQARSAPVPSPRRMSRSRSVLAFRALSIASWPRSPERWEKSRALVIVESVLRLQWRLTVAMNPSMSNEALWRWRLR